jgi:hypothetical protein
VAVAIVRALAVVHRREAVPHPAGELLMAGADTRVDDVGVDALPRLVVVVGVVEGQVSLVDPVEPPRGRGLGRHGVEDLVGLDVLDARIVREGCGLLAGQLDREALERVLVDVADGATVSAAELCCDGCNRRPCGTLVPGARRVGLQDDDVVGDGLLRVADGTGTGRCDRGENDCRHGEDASCHLVPPAEGYWT